MDELERGVARGVGDVERWSRVQVLSQASEAADTSAVCTAKWARIYRLFGTEGEGDQDEVFGAVNMYFLQNGTSWMGKYSKPIRTAGGKEVIAGELTKVTGHARGEIRQFMRGRLKDSYYFLKYNKAIADDEHLVAKAQNAGIPRSQAWLLADWLGDNCPYFVGDEADVYRKYRASAIALANVRRSDSAANDSRDEVIDAAPESRDVGRGGQNYNTGLF